jgi:hypothetical protein
MTQARPSNFGQRLTPDQYQERVGSLHKGLRPEQQVANERDVRRKELDLMVDLQLGIGFPADRREALWHAQQRLDKRRLLSLVGSLLTYPTDPLKGIARAQVRGFSRVLDRAELSALLDLTEDELSKLL